MEIVFTYILPCLLKYEIKLSDIILILTFFTLLWYTWETMKIRKETVRQTELKTMPIMVLYIRIVPAGKATLRNEYAITFQTKNSIEPSNYYIALRNVGEGPAFNVGIESNNFKAQKYQTRFFAPLKDEHAVKIIRKPANKIRELKELENEIFVVKCHSVQGDKYEYKYRINNVEEKSVEFIK